MRKLGITTTFRTVDAAQYKRRLDNFDFDIVTMALGGSFNLTPASGGLTYAGIVNSVASNTSGALSVNSQNTSGTNTLSGFIVLDSNLAINQSAGGALNLTQLHTDGAIGANGINIKTLALTFAPDTGATTSRQSACQGCCVEKLRSPITVLTPQSGQSIFSERSKPTQAFKCTRASSSVIQPASKTRHGAPLIPKP